MDNEKEVRRTAQVTDVDRLEEYVSEYGELSYVDRKKIDSRMKHFLKTLPKKPTAKELAKAEKVNRGMEKIYALIDRGLNHVTSNR